MEWQNDYKKTELKKEITLYNQLLEEHDTVLARKLGEVESAFDSLQSELGEVVSNHRIMQPFFVKFGNSISVNGKLLSVNGNVAEPFPVSAANCFSLYQNLSSRYFSLLKAILSDWNRFCSSNDSSQLLYTVAQLYNSLAVMYVSLPQLREEYLCEIKSNSSKERQNAEEKKKNAEKRLSELTESERLRAQDIKTVRAYISFSDSERLEAKDEFSTSITLPIGYCVETAKVLEWDFSKHGVLRVITESCRIENDTDLCSFVENTVYRFFNSYAAGVTRLFLYDGVGRIEFKKLMTNLTSDLIIGDNDISDKVVYSPVKSIESCVDAFESACELIESRKIFDIFSSNAENSVAPQPIYLFVLYGCSSFTALKESLLASMRLCREKGVFFLIIEKEEAEGKNSFGTRDGNLSRIANCLTLRMQEKGLICTDKEHLFCLAKIGEGFDSVKYAKKLGDAVSTMLKRSIPLTGLLEKYDRNETEDFSKVISVPVGIDEIGKIRTLSFSTDNSTSHCAIYGTTGSGKSSVLQAIILGGAYYYSPNEIEFYLIDMKGGSAFYDKTNFDYSRLKHVKMVAANCSKNDLRDFVNFIVTERMSESKKNIASYNKTHSGSERIKRTVVVIDEYNAINDAKCIAHLEQIASQGRSFGVSLILSANEKNNNFAQVLLNVGNVVEFRSNEVGYLIGKQNISVSSADINFTKNLKGNCIMYDGNSSNRIFRFRAAYSAYQNDLIDEINGKYPDCEAPNKIVLGNMSRLKERFAAAPAKTALEKMDASSAFAALIGKSLFDTPYGMEFGKGQTKNLLLLGDSERAASMEYSIIASMGRGKSFYFNFSGRTAPIFTICADVCEEKEAISRGMQELYDLYKKRASSDMDTFEPVVAVLHNASDCARILLETIESSAPAKQTPQTPLMGATPSPAEESPKAAIDDVDEEYSKANPIPFSAVFASMTTPAKIFSENLASMLREIMKDGIAYGICVIVHADFEGIQKDSDIFGKPLAKVFAQAVVLPSLLGDDQIAKENVSGALKLVGAGDSVDMSVFTANERIRCYHTIGKECRQFIPYEWEKSK